MKLFRSLIAFLIVAAFASCNTPNRPKLENMVEGTPTNADTVLYRSRLHSGDSLAKPHPLPIVFHR